MTEVPILNHQQALEAAGWNEETFHSILNSYDQEHFNEDALRLHKGIMKKDLKEISTGGYRMKFPASYFGAQRLYNICAELQRKGAAQESMDLIVKDYVEFLNIARDLKKEAAKILKRPVSLDIKDFDIFEVQIKSTFPEYFPESNVSPICHGCNIF